MSESNELLDIAMPRRVIPLMLLKGSGFVKTRKFEKPVYLGDPLNTVKIFNEKGADEIVVLDINATHSGAGPDFDNIGEIASECFMPLTYGGGIRSLDDCRRLFRAGCEKISLNTAAFADERFVRDAVAEFGAQSVVVSVDYRVEKSPVIYTHGGKVKVKTDLLTALKRIEQLGAGEILLQCIDRDGEMGGYDTATFEGINKCLRIPLVIAGGSRGREDFLKAFEMGASGAAGGACFVFSGPRRGVLISYRNIDQD